MKYVIQIVGISNKGDGYGFLNGKKVFIPYSIIDDKIEFELISENSKFIKGKISKIIEKSNDRVKPPCPYFYKCGGCTLQHLNKKSYYKYKLNIVKDAVSYSGFDTDCIEKIIKIEDGCRRRVIFKVGKSGELGFFRKESNEIIDIDYCLIAREEINKLIKPLKKLVQKLSRDNLKEIFVSYVDDGNIDLILKLKKELNFREFELWKTFIDKYKIACLNYDLGNGLILVYNKKALKMEVSNNKGTLNLSLPAGTFLQATKEGQKAITKEVVKVLKTHHNVLDLYSGVGTYTFPLISYVDKIVAVEGYRNMVESIKQNALTNNLNNKIEAFSRDLVNRPLMLEKLNEFDGMVINPPRNGSKAQCEIIAKSNIRTIVIVSCNPSAFSVDSKILKDGGYNLERVVGIDQFYWSSHLEIVGVFKK